MLICGFKVKTSELENYWRFDSVMLSLVYKKHLNTMVQYNLETGQSDKEMVRQERILNYVGNQIRSCKFGLFCLPGKCAAKIEECKSIKCRRHYLKDNGGRRSSD